MTPSLSHLTATIDRAAVLAYFKGKAKEKASAALDALEACLAAGHWIKGAGGERGIVAALDKVRPTTKALLAGIPENGGYSYSDERRSMHWDAHFTMSCGRFQHAARFTGEHFAVLGDAPVVPLFVAYRDAFAPVAAAIEALNAVIPPPVVTQMGASPTVTATLTSLGATAVAPCPREYTFVDRVDPKTGQLKRHPVCRLLWPEGTQHGTSRFKGGCQCQACGHAIRNGFNWAPLVLTTPDGPKSLWTGQDCARTLFGVDFGGPLEIEGGRGA
jgi:hypothetical protein